MRFHLLANAHLDPVWLWDWREGLNQGITTCHTVVRLMDEFPELTFLRGESSVYKHIQEYAPKLFDRIAELVAADRWEIVGGNFCQPDTNLPATEVLCRQFYAGINYFQHNFKRRPTVAWAPDSFGHSRGWPEIYAAAGMQNLAFSRPFEVDCQLPGPAFWWQSQSGRKILCWRIPFGWYGSERIEIAERLDRYRDEAEKWGLQDIGIFFGLGDHGGGPSRRQIADILKWRYSNPGVTVTFSSLHKFFAALRASKVSFPVVDKELNYTLRGCYSSAAHFKFSYRKTENLLLSAESTNTIISASFGRKGENLQLPWEGLLFNTFHDILPGTAIERAFEDQRALLGMTYHAAQRAQLSALNLLAEHVDTSVPVPEGDMPSAVPVIIWNGLPQPLAGNAEFEVCLDDRPIRAYKGKASELPVSVTDHLGRNVAFQIIENESHFGTDIPWRRRFVVPMDLPAMGWRVLRVAWDERATIAADSSAQIRCKNESVLSNKSITVEARKGAHGISITVGKKKLFGGEGLQVQTLEDHFGSWGGHDGEKEADDISTVLHEWSIIDSRVLEKGPCRGSLWVRLSGGKSLLDLTFYLDKSSIIRVAARLVWNERGARIKLVMPGVGNNAVYEVPGGTVERAHSGEVPGGRWVRVSSQSGIAWLFGSDALYNFDLKEKEFRATIVRSTRYAWSAPSKPSDMPWLPHMDIGEHRFQFGFAIKDSDHLALSGALENPFYACAITPRSNGGLPIGSLLQLPNYVRLLALKPAGRGDGWILRVQGLSNTRKVPFKITWLGEKLQLRPLGRHEIGSWWISRLKSKWHSKEVNVAEEIL
jgi:alpha-mannosidase